MPLSANGLYEHTRQYVKYPARDDSDLLMQT